MHLRSEPLTNHIKKKKKKKKKGNGKGKKRCQTGRAGKKEKVEISAERK